MSDFLLQVQSDITYIKTASGWLYLTTIIDLYDRQVIGWSLSTRLYTNQTIIPAWEMAISKRQITEPLLFHSDRGIQYASREFRKLIKKSTLITQSMSRMQKTGKVCHQKRKFLSHIKNQLSLSYKRNYNDYCYAHFNPPEVAHFDRPFQINETEPIIRLLKK